MQCVHIKPGALVAVCQLTIEEISMASLVSDNELPFSSSTSASALTSSSNSRLKLCYLDQVKIFIVSPSRLSFSKLITTAAQAFPEIEYAGHRANTPHQKHSSIINQNTCLFELTYYDQAGDKVLIDGDEALRLAFSCFQESLNLKVQIHLKLDHAIISRQDNIPRQSSMPTPASPCWYFKAGLCKFGSSCRFSHHLYDGGCNIKLQVSSNSALTLRESDIENWMINQLKASEHDNISYLSSAEGFDSMMQILNQPHLPAFVIDQLVLLLTRPVFRTSLLKQATDKIYNALIGSQFLITLHSQIRGTVKCSPGSVEAYVSLCEELVARTSNGWKEAPLDVVKTLVDEVEHDLESELNYTMARLLNQKAKKMRMDIMDDGQLEALSLGSNFRNLPIIPSKEQLLSLDNPNQLPVNQVGIRYPSVAAYLDTHFRLMQENCIGIVREYVRKLCRNSRDPKLHVHMNVHLEDSPFENEAIVFGVNQRKIVDRDSLRSLTSGSLLCISCDTFQNFFWAVIKMWAPHHLSEGVIVISLLEDSDQRRLEASKVYTMAVLPVAYFEAQCHVLKNLQRPEMDNFPFQEHLISLEPHVKEPVYLKSRNQQDIYDFECAFPLMKEELSTTRFHILQSWPEWTSSLDRSQMSALKHGLTKRLALIQGPPGTGKTFIGLLIVKILLENLKQTSPTSNAVWRPSHLKKLRERTSPQEKAVGGPILIVCYTNHALDQFLEGVYAYEKNVVKVGEKTNRSELEECSLQTLVQRKQREWELSCRGHGYGSFPESSLYVKRKKAYRKRDQLQKEIHECAELLNIDVATEALLHGVAAEEQIRSLFYEGCNIKTVVNVWLLGQEKGTHVDTVAHGKLQKSNAQPQMHSVLMEEEDCNREALIDSTTGCSMSHEIRELVEFHRSDEEGKLGLSAGSAEGSQGFLQGECLDDSLQGDGFQSSSLCNGNTRRGSARENKMRIILGGYADVSQRSDLAGEWLSPQYEAWTPQEGTTGMMPNTLDVVDVQENEWPLEMLMNQTNVWSLDGRARRVLHKYWVDTIRREAQDKMALLCTQYDDLRKSKEEVRAEIRLSLLRTAKVVGMTTTVAAQRQSMLKSLQAEILVVVEAAHVLESHILGCMAASTKHLILIGDHLQLCPPVDVDDLAVKHHLDVSLFERLVRSGIEHVTMEEQRRMRPCISKLVSSIYPMLRDHESVWGRENIKGIKSNVFFFNHNAPEEQSISDNEWDKMNVEEAELVVGLYDYFLKQGYTEKDITILSMYRGQTEAIHDRLVQKLQAEEEEDPLHQERKLPWLGIAKNYQGQECKIVILSLVASKHKQDDGPASTSRKGNHGLVEDPNRVCVALSRARDGLFMFGDGEVLSEKGELWKTVIGELQRSESSYGEALVLSCQNHPDTETRICKPIDFPLQVPHGGCNRPCQHQLSCGHVCPKRCHPSNVGHGVCIEADCPRNNIPSGNLHQLHQSQAGRHGIQKYVPPMLRRP